MAASTSKRVFIYRFDRQPSEGVVNPATCFTADHLEVISLGGTVSGVNYADLKALCFISESAEPDLFNRHFLFERRPKFPGLWVRFTLRDGSQVEGILAHNLLEWPEYGYLFTPPRSGGQRQRVFIPRLAIQATEIRGVIGTIPAAPERKATMPAEQLPMFE